MSDSPLVIAPYVRLISVGLRPPTAVQSEWRDPADDNPNRREARVVKGTRAHDAVYAAHRRPGSLITIQHVRAANRYLTDYEIGVLGAHPNAPERVGGSRSQGILYPQEQQNARIRSISLADRALGTKAAEIVHHVVLGIPDPLQRDVASYARRFGIDAKLAMGLLVAALERLVEHYQVGEK